MKIKGAHRKSGCVELDPVKYDASTFQYGGWEDWEEKYLDKDRGKQASYLTMR